VAERLEVGEKAIYPAHGAGVIDAIEKRVISGKEQVFYIMRILHNGLTIMIPIDKVSSIGVRKPIPLQEVERIYRMLKRRSLRPAGSPERWSRRYRKYKEKMRTGSAYEIAGILKALHQTKRTRALSTSERIMIDTATDLLVGEVSCSKNMREERIRREIELLLHGA
jgi:CarD family transcriptional regulator